ncbi:hypothetical protein STANM337S_06494 [Streptomyces tanashiensis]
MDKETISQWSEGLIASTGCPSGELQTRLRLGQFDEALKAASEYQDIFGKDRYFLELMDHGKSWMPSGSAYGERRFRKCRMASVRLSPGVFPRGTPRRLCRAGTAVLTVARRPAVGGWVRCLVSARAYALVREGDRLMALISEYGTLMRIPYSEMRAFLCGFGMVLMGRQHGFLEAICGCVMWG